MSEKISGGAFGKKFQRHFLITFSWRGVSESLSSETPTHARFGGSRTVRRPLGWIRVTLIDSSYALAVFFTLAI
jgi:hypothetical protein